MAFISISNVSDFRQKYDGIPYSGYYNVVKILVHENVWISSFETIACESKK